MKIFKTVNFFDSGIHTKKYYFCGIRYLKKKWAMDFKETFLFNFRISGNYSRNPKCMDFLEYKTHNPLVSIVVASYNYEDLIVETLDSLVAQTYKNFEIIVVDDGSKDNSVEVIKRYVDKYPFVKLYQHKNGENRGLPATIELAIKKSKGEYIAFCESDDCWTPDHLQEKINVINKTGVPFIINDIRLIGNPTKQYEDYIRGGLESLPIGRSFCNIVNTNPVATWSCVMIRADILRMCNFDSYIPAWVDWWVYRQILTKYPLYRINKKLTLWRIHNSYNAPTNSSKYELQKGVFISKNNKIIGLQSYYSKNHQIIANSNYWDEDYYITNYKDKLDGMEPIEHYLNIGWKEGLNPSEQFDTNAYLSAYIDVCKANFCPLLHYEMHGKKEQKKIYSIGECKEFSIEKFLENIEKLDSEKIIILVSHELSLTGAPRALLNMAISLKKQGFYPVVFAYQYGDMCKEILANNIDLVIDLHLYVDLLNKNFDNLVKLLSKSDLILFNTLVSLPLVDLFPEVEIRKIAWLHEGSMSYLELKNVIDYQSVFEKLYRIYSVGNYSKSFADKYIEDSSKSHILLYGIKDIEITCATNENHKPEAVKFILPGMVSQRKGHDILLKALKNIPDNVKDKVVVYIVGPCGDIKLEKDVLKEANNNNNIRYLGSLPHNELMKLYEEIDVVLCPSRDDPMPIVCTEGFAMKKTVVVSENTGTAAFIEKGKNGFVIPSEDEKALADVMLYIVNHKHELKNIGENARKIYEDNFTEFVFDENIKNIFNYLVK